MRMTDRFIFESLKSFIQAYSSRFYFGYGIAVLTSVMVSLLCLTNFMFTADVLHVLALIMVGFVVAVSVLRRYQRAFLVGVIFNQIVEGYLRVTEQQLRAAYRQADTHLMNMQCLGADTTRLECRFARIRLRHDKSLGSFVYLQTEERLEPLLALTLPNLDLMRSIRIYWKEVRRQCRIADRLVRTLQVFSGSEAPHTVARQESLRRCAVAG